MNDPSTVRAPEDTIAAIATGVSGAIVVLRLSGPDATKVAAKVWRGRVALSAVPPRTMTLGRIVNADGITEDHCLMVIMPRPRSFTGEDMVEFHCHGGAMVARSVLSLLLINGARHAEPGEFTKRAFINGKIDLTQAEAVVDVIQAQSSMALHAANRQLAGILKRQIDSLLTTLIDVLSEIEARMDFSDEDLDWESPERLNAKISVAREEIEALLASRRDGEILRDGVRVAIVGVPNAGKSSLLNSILGRDRAIVTPIPGTTRDTLEEPVQIRGIPVRLIDTAGIRDTCDLVEQQGVARSFSSIEEAQLILWVIDPTQDLEGQRHDRLSPMDSRVLIVVNKMDLVPDNPVRGQLPGPLVEISALTGVGLERLYDAVEERVWRHPHTAEPEVAVSSRHALLLETARQYIDQATAIMNQQQYELIAVQLRGAIDALGTITGRTVQPDILDVIFHKFCIGK